MNLLKESCFFFLVVAVVTFSDPCFFSSEVQAEPLEALTYYSNDITFEDFLTTQRRVVVKKNK